MIRILSNIKNLDRATAPGGVVFAHDYLSNETAMQFVRKCLHSDVVILNIDQRRLMLASMLRALPFVRFRLVSVDLVLRPPRSAKDRLKVLLKRILFSRVDRFVLYFKNLSGYEKFYGISPTRTTYVPFKVNGWEQIVTRTPGSAGGDYVICAGRTLRDVKTFVEAMRRAKCPAVLLQQKHELLSEHGTSAWAGEIPSNVKLIVDESDRLEDYLDFISRARLVVIPRFNDDIAPTGISTYLVAMALNKCVVISSGPGADDLLSNQAVIVPPGDSESLGDEIQRLWNDDAVRNKIAARGREYAMALEGEQRLFSDILRVGIETYGKLQLVVTDSRQAEACRTRHAETARQTFPIAAPIGVRQTSDDV